MTAHRAVFADGPVHGQYVLVTGGAGAVGTAAMQLAKWGGARPSWPRSAPTAKAAVARDAGADHTINYKTDDVVAEVQQLTQGTGVDRIVEVDFGGNLPVSLQIIKPHGTIASYATRGEPEPKVPFRALMLKNVTVHGVLVYTMPEFAKAAGDGRRHPRAHRRRACGRSSALACRWTASPRRTPPSSRAAIIGNVVLHHA